MHVVINFMDLIGLAILGIVLILWLVIWLIIKFSEWFKGGGNNA